MTGIFKSIYYSSLFGKLFHTLDFCLQRELADCETVLDLGCGPSSPLRYCKCVKYSVGVEAFKPYLDRAKKAHTHTEFVAKNIAEVDFPAKSFDAVIMLEVLEHMSPDIADKILNKAQRWAKKKIIVSSPNGFLPQKAVDENVLQKHLSGWEFQKMKKMGFKSSGLAGLKIFRTEVQNTTMGDDFTTSIRFRPRFFWFVIASLSQIPAYFFPQLAFELFSVKLMK